MAGGSKVVVKYLFNFKIKFQNIVKYLFEF